MKLRILSIGHKMPNWVQQGFEEYLKRIQPMISVEMVELPPAKRSKTPHLPRLINIKPSKRRQF